MSTRKVLTANDARGMFEQQILRARITKEYLDKQIEYAHFLARYQLECAAVYKEQRKLNKAIASHLEANLSSVIDQEFIKNYDGLFEAFNLTGQPSEKMAQMSKRLSELNSEIKVLQARIAQISASLPPEKVITNLLVVYEKSLREPETCSEAARGSPL